MRRGGVLATRRELHDDRAASRVHGVGDAAWFPWSVSISATATLVSTKQMRGVSALVGLAQGLHEVVVDQRAGRRHDKPAAPLHQLVPCKGQHAQARALRGDLHLARLQADLLAESARDDDAACIVDGGAHAIRLRTLLCDTTVEPRTGGTAACLRVQGGAGLKMSNHHARAQTALQEPR